MDVCTPSRFDASAVDVPSAIRAKKIPLFEIDGTAFSCAYGRAACDARQAMGRAAVTARCPAIASSSARSTPSSAASLASGKVSFDAERTTRGGHADRFWAIALACQKERGPAPRTGTEIGVRGLG